MFAIFRKIVFEIPSTIILNVCFGNSGIAYGAFVAEFMMACISTVVLMQMMKKLLNS